MIRTRPTRDDKRYEALHSIGCIACVVGKYPSPCGRTEMHHLVDKGYREHSGGNQATIPLGQWHHQGIPFMGRTVTWMRNMYGPSMKLESKVFADTFGSQRALLARVNSIITGNRGIAT